MAITFAVTIAYSRLWLGVHSLDQVLFGMLLGVWCAFTMQYCARSYVEKEVGMLTKCQVTEFRTRFWICTAVFAFIMTF